MTATRVDYFCKYRVEFGIEYVDRSGAMSHLYLKSAYVETPKEGKLVGAIFLEQFYANYEKNWNKLPAMYRKHAKNHGKPMVHIWKCCETGKSHSGGCEWIDGKVVC